MINFKNATIAVALGLTLMVVASPAMAKSVHHHGYNARAQQIETGVGEGDGFVSRDRAQALRQCNEAARKFLDYTWGDFQSYQMRACMSEHGQPE
jgi:hypothetical protein